MRKTSARTTVGFLVGAMLLLPPGAGPTSAERRGRGSVKNSSKSRSSAANRPSTTHRPATRPPAARPPAGGAARGGYRSGYRRGYSHGRHASYHSAWHSWRRWRAVTGLFVLGVYAA